MTRAILALFLFALAAVSGSMILDDYRDGAMRVAFGTINPLVFAKSTSPAWFWGAAMLNSALVAGMILGGGILLVGAWFGI